MLKYIREKKKKKKEKKKNLGNGHGDGWPPIQPSERLGLGGNMGEASTMATEPGADKTRRRVRKSPAWPAPKWVEPTKTDTARKPTTDRRTTSLKVSPPQHQQHQNPSLRHGDPSRRGANAPIIVHRLGTSTPWQVGLRLACLIQVSSCV